MRFYSKILSTLAFASLAINSQADTRPIHISNIKPSQLVLANQEVRILLNDLWPGAVYTVTCDIINNDYSEHATLISFGNNHLLLNPIFTLNSLPNSAFLNQRINKYVANQVSKTSGNGYFLSMFNCESDKKFQFSITNCFATLAID